MNREDTINLLVKKTILIVEDDEINRTILSAILEDDYNILTATNGQEALDVLNNEINKISLILLDLIMPVMDGYTFLKIKRDNEIIKDIPLIVLTSEKSAEVECLNLGAMEFITKPFEEIDVIKVRVRHLIELYEKTVIIKQSSDDGLTNLYNKEFFMTYAKQLLTYNNEMDLIGINLLNFSILTEIIGKTMSEDLLKSVAEELKAIARQYNGIAGRAYDDDFYLLITPQNNYDFINDRINNVIQSKFTTLHTRSRLGIYPRVTLENEINISCDRVIQCAHMIHSQEQTDIKFFDENFNKMTLYHQRLITDFDKAIAEDQFVIYFQPKFDIKGEKPVVGGAEALVRWIHPELGFISPGDFIPLFEDNGLISKLDLYVFERVCRHIVDFRKVMKKVPTISVNLSRVDFYIENLSTVICDLIKKYNLQPNCINIEVTESAYVSETNHLVEKVKELQDLGFKFEIDDFGSGYSSVYTVVSMPFDVLKLDMVFMRNFNQNDKVKTVVARMIDMVKSLNGKVVAEGVETSEQYNYLKDNNCDYIQGYYLSKPIPADAFLKLIVSEEKNDN